MKLINKQQMFTNEYDELYEYIWRYVSLRVFAYDDREDVTADICLHAYQSLKNYDPSMGSLRKWITGVARYRILHYIRRKEVFADIDIEHVLEDHTQRIEDVLNAQQDIDAVLCELSQEQRSLLYLYYVDGFTHEQLAKKHKISTAAMRKRISRILQNIRKSHQL